MGVDPTLQSSLVDIRTWADQYPEKYKVARWCTVLEAEILRSIASHYKYVLEIGTANGYSAIAMAQSGAMVHTFDPVNRPKIWEDITEGLELLDLTYFDYIPTFESECGYIDVADDLLIFIDGDHSQEAVKNDIQFAQLLEAKGIIFHDYIDPPVRRAINKNLSDDYTKYKLSTERGMVYARR